ncbi:MAG: hypothetical protein AVDCRST_MAG67-250, partial [uncultured Solirubrobacteraceae bacterium]
EHARSRDAARRRAHPSPGPEPAAGAAGPGHHADARRRDDRAVSAPGGPDPDGLGHHPLDRRHAPRDARAARRPRRAL